MKRIPYRLCALLIALLMTVSLCACKGNDTNVTETQSTTTIGDTETTVTTEGGISETTTTVADADGSTVGTTENTTDDAANKTTSATTQSTLKPTEVTTSGNSQATIPVFQKTTTTEVTTTTTTSSTAATTKPTEDDGTAIIARTYPLVDIQDKLNIYGRTGLFKGGLFFDHTAAGIEFTAYMEGTVSLSISQTTTGSMTSYYTVWIDGVRQEERLKATSKSPKKHTIATFAEGGVHTIRILKQSEMGVSISFFKDLSFTGYLMDPPKERELHIEFLGDSITSGYGNVMYVDGVGDTSASPVSAVNSDGTQTYAFLAAEKLNARCTIISDSGIGVVYEHGSVPGRRMSNFWRYNSYARQDLGEYTPTEAPDLMVINLGTNDRMNSTTDNAMVTGVKDLITQIRTTYNKDVPIVWATGMMHGAKEEQVKQALKELGGEDAKLYYLALTPNGEGGGGHPDVDSHQQNADKLVKYLQNKNLV